MTGLEVQAAVLIDARRVMKRAEGLEIRDPAQGVVLSSDVGSDGASEDGVTLPSTTLFSLRSTLKLGIWVARYISLSSARAMSLTTMYLHLRRKGQIRIPSTPQP